MTNQIERIIKVYQETDTPFYLQVVLAQWVIESASGTSELATKANNFFGHKAKQDWNGEIYLKDAFEEVNGVLVNVGKTEWRKYKSLEDCVKHHLNWLTRATWASDHYKRSINAKTPQEQAEMLELDGYATDSGYAEALIKKMNEMGYLEEKKGNDIMSKLYPIQRYLTNVNFENTNNAKKFIVIHFVGARGQAWDNGKYFRDVYREASAQYFVDPNNIVQVVDDNKVAWHIGDGNWSKVGSHNGYVKSGMATNYNSIGIEMCQDVTTGNNAWEWQIHQKTYEQTLLLTKMLMEKYNIPISNVIRHYDASGKNCPGCWNDGGKWTKWHQFKKDLANIGKVDTDPQKVTSSVLDYRKPAKPFKDLKVGDTVTIRKGFENWYIPETNSMKKPSKNFVGTKDKIKKVMKVSISYSDTAYLLEGYNSWILEQDLVEPRADWVVVEKPKEPVKEQKPEMIIQDNKGYVYVDGVKYDVNLSKSK